MDFTNKVVLITGASSGIGAATAIQFAKHGASVVIVGRNEKKLKKVADEIEKYTKNFLVINADLSQEDEVKSLVKKTVDKFGKLDILVNNAGTFQFGSILDGKLLDVYQETMDTNLKAPVVLTTLAAPHLIESKGNIVNISSAFSQLVSKVPQNIIYSVSKAGLDHFTRCSALELAPHGVRVNAINPGPVKTDIIENAGFSADQADILRKEYEAKVPLKKTAEAVEIADLVLFLASDKAKSITGSLYFSDNGACLG